MQTGVVAKCDVYTLHHNNIEGLNEGQCPTFRVMILIAEMHFIWRKLYHMILCHCNRHKTFHTHTHTTNHFSCNMRHLWLSLSPKPIFLAKTQATKMHIYTIASRIYCNTVLQTACFHLLSNIPPLVLSIFFICLLFCTSICNKLRLLWTSISLNTPSYIS